MNAAQPYLLDTNIASYIMTGRSLAARNTLKSASADRVVLISSLTEAELLFGLEMKPHATRLRRSILEFLQPLEIRGWDSAAALAYSRLRAQLQSSGKALANMDLLIASHAIALGAVLVTHDRALHNLSQQLTVEDWATDMQ